MDLSIIIVNWNSKDYLFKAIASVEADTKGIDFEMVVIDGAHLLACAEMLRQVYPHIVFIQSPDKNLRFLRRQTTRLQRCREVEPFYSSILILKLKATCSHNVIRPAQYSARCRYGWSKTF